MIHFVESWASYAIKTDALRWYYQAGVPVMQDGGVLMAGASGSFLNARVPVGDRVRIGFWHECRKRPPTVKNSSFMHLPFSGDTNSYNQVGFGMNPDGTLSVFCGANFSGLGGVTLANGATVIPLNEKHWIELDVLVHATAGTVEVRVNGVPEIVLAGVCTKNSLFKPLIDRVTICGGANVSSHWFGGMYVGDGADGWFGPREFLALPSTDVAAPAGAVFAACSIDAMVPPATPI